MDLVGNGALDGFQAAGRQRGRPPRRAVGAHDLAHRPGPILGLGQGLEAGEMGWRDLVLDGGRHTGSALAPMTDRDGELVRAVDQDLAVGAALIDQMLARQQIALHEQGRHHREEMLLSGVAPGSSRR
jgi:hypothetical protein